MPGRGGLYVVTGDDFSRGRPYQDVVKACIEGGAAVIQLREKAWPAARLLAIGRELRQMTRDAGVLFIVNDRLDIAQALDADGVHVGQQDLPIETVRKIVGPQMIVGVSAGTPDEARAAEEGGASYLGVGPIFPTQTKRDARAPRGLAMLGEIRQSTGLPIYGIGGITVENVGAVIAAGADGAAVVSAVVGADDIFAAARVLVSKIETAKR